MVHDLGSPWGNPPFTNHHSADQDLNSQTSEPPKDPGPVRFAPRAAAAQRFLGAGFLGDARGVPSIGLEKSVEKYGNMLKSIWFNLVYSKQFIGK